MYECYGDDEAYSSKWVFIKKIKKMLSGFGFCGEASKCRQVSEFPERVGKYF